MIAISTLILTNTLRWIFIVLACCNNSQQVDRSLHSDTLSWFRANYSLLLLLNAAYIAANSNFIVLSLTRPWLKPTIYHTWVEQHVRPIIQQMQSLWFDTFFFEYKNYNMYFYLIFPVLFNIIHITCTFNNPSSGLYFNNCSATSKWPLWQALNNGVAPSYN